MSRIGKLPIPVPSGVTVKLEGNIFKVKGPLGELQQDFLPEVSVSIDDNQVLVLRAGESKQHRAYHGLYRALFANMVHGVSVGFSKTLLITGVGYRANLEKINGRDHLVFKKGELGYSHPINFPIPDGLTAEVPDKNKIIIKGCDKALVGQIAAKVRELRPPDSYKGKGVRYENEVVRLKVGKRAK